MLVAATFTAAAIAPQSAIGRFLLRPKVAVATALYIAVTCIVYYFLLSGLLHLNGFDDLEPRAHKRMHAVQNRVWQSNAFPYSL